MTLMKIGKRHPKGESLLNIVLARDRMLWKYMIKQSDRENNPFESVDLDSAQSQFIPLL